MGPSNEYTLYSRATIEDVIANARDPMLHNSCIRPGISDMKLVCTHRDTKYATMDRLNPHATATIISSLKQMMISHARTYIEVSQCTWHDV